jgi:hypothetical protein
MEQTFKETTQSKLENNRINVAHKTRMSFLICIPILLILGFITGIFISNIIGEYIVYMILPVSACVFIIPPIIVRKNRLISGSF